MAQSTGKEIQQIEELNRKKAAQTSRVADLDRERSEAKQELDSIETNRKAAVGALDSMKKRYFSRRLGTAASRSRPRRSAASSIRASARSRRSPRSSSGT